MTFTDIAVIVVMIYIMCWCVQKVIETILDNYFYERYYLDEEGAKMDDTEPKEYTVIIDPESLRPIIEKILQEKEEQDNRRSM